MNTPKITPETKLQRIRDVVATDMNGETVMMHIDKGSYFALTGSGGHIWSALEAPSTLNEVIRSVEAEFDTDDVTDLSDTVRDFVQNLLGQGLVDIVE